MAGYAAFLRAINLGHHRRISGAELRSRFEEIGFHDVSTFRTSGNVVFAAEREPSTRVADRIEAALRESLGYEVAVLIRTAGEVRAIADARPFARPLIETSDGTLQVVLLRAKPAARTREAVLALASDEDRLAFGERELYWLPSAGIRDCALDITAIGRLLGPTTMRTKGTVDGLAAKYFAG